MVSRVVSKVGGQSGRGIWRLVGSVHALVAKCGIFLFEERSTPGSMVREWWVEREVGEKGRGTEGRVRYHGGGRRSLKKRGR